jgi:hypothetical protein
MYLSTPSPFSLPLPSNTLRFHTVVTLQVKAWQQSVLQTARLEGYTRTLMGRYRELPEINSKSSLLRGHAERAAINTPIQGQAVCTVFRTFITLAMCVLGLETSVSSCRWCCGRGYDGDAEGVSR